MCKGLCKYCCFEISLRTRILPAMEATRRLGLAEKRQPQGMAPSRAGPTPLNCQAIARPAHHSSKYREKADTWSRPGGQGWNHPRECTGLPEPPSAHGENRLSGWREKGTA